MAAAVQRIAIEAERHRFTFRHTRRTVLIADSGEGGQAFHLKADSESGRWRTAFR
jgi:hypothetical protein